MYLYSFSIPSFAAETYLPRKISICDGPNWAPFIYTENKGDTKLVGLLVDVLTEIFTPLGIEVETKVLPWKRCLHSVEIGEVNIVSASWNEERAKNYNFSDKVYHLRHGLFYKVTKFPQGLDISTNEKIESLSLGGQDGFNYSFYDFDTSVIDLRAGSTINLVKMLQHERYDAVIGYIEVYQGLQKLGRLNLDDLDSVTLSNANQLNFFYMTTKSDVGQAISNTISEGLTRLRNTGCLLRIHQRYGVETIR